MLAYESSGCGEESAYQMLTFKLKIVRFCFTYSISIHVFSCFCRLLHLFPKILNKCALALDFLDSTVEYLNKPKLQAKQTHLLAISLCEDAKVQNKENYME